MSPYLERLEREYAAAPPLPPSVVAWTPWLVWVLVIPVALYAIIVAFV